MMIHIPSHLSDVELEHEVRYLAGREREATATLVAHLAEFDERRLYLAAGFSSLFKYCCEVLRLSEAEAYNRIEAARVARRFPRVLDSLSEGSLNITTVRILASALTVENHLELFSAASGKSKREVEELVVRYCPRPDVPSSIRKLPVPTASVATPCAPVAEPVSVPPAAAPSVSPPRPAVAPLAPDRYAIRFTASASTCEKLRLAQDMLRHAVPSGDMAEIIDRALTVLLEDLARKKFAQTDRPRASRGTAPGSRNIAARIRRPVALRDGGRCAFVSRGGRRCNERAFIEFHHVDPYGVGGEAAVDTIELRCRAHNNYEAALFYRNAARFAPRFASSIVWRRNESGARRQRKRFASRAGRWGTREAGSYGAGVASVGRGDRWFELSMSAVMSQRPPGTRRSVRTNLPRSSPPATGPNAPMM
jgi:hypothetical protein